MGYYNEFESDLINGKENHSSKDSIEVSEGYEVDKKDFNLVKTDKILMFILKKSTIFLFIKSLFNLSNMKFI